MAIVTWCFRLIGHLAECILVIGHFTECILVIGHLTECFLVIGHFTDCFLVVGKFTDCFPRVGLLLAAWTLVMAPRHTDGCAERGVNSVASVQKAVR